MEHINTNFIIITNLIFASSKLKCLTTNFTSEGVYVQHIILQEGYQILQEGYQYETLFPLKIRMLNISVINRKKIRLIWTI